MKSRCTHVLCVFGLFVPTFIVSPLVVNAQVNNWTDGSGKWETATNWSLGVAPASTQDVSIANSNTKTVTIDTTTTNAPATMTVNSFTVEGTEGVNTNTLFLNNVGLATPLHALTDVSLGESSSIIVNHSALKADGGISIGFSAGITQLIVTNGGSVISLNGTIGNSDGSDHLALITGSNSVWSVYGTLQVGSGIPSNDRLTISSGGTFIASNATHTAVVLLNNATINDSNGTFQADNLIITNGGSFLVSSNLVVAGTANSTGSVAIVGGQLVVTNGTLGIGNNGSVTSGGGVGTMTVSNATVIASGILLGSSAGGQGHLTLYNAGAIRSAGSNSILAVNGFDQIGGSLGWTNIGSAMYCGYAHPGEYTLSNGTSSCQDVYVGYDNTGSMTIAGGTMNILSRLSVGQLGSPVSTGAVWITGGQLTIINQTAIIGNSGEGQMTISNGTVTANGGVVGNGSNGGSLTMAGGTMAVFSNLTVGNCADGMTGIVTITGGNLYVTNATQDATLDVRSGRVTLNGGLLQVDKLVMTNSCGLFIRGGGALIIGSLLLDPNLDADGDGMPNGWELSHGLNPLDASDAANDNDGDGLSNLREYQLGTDPNDPSSPYRITAITREGTNMRVTWSTVGGDTNVVQASPGRAGGNYTNNFSDLSPQLIISGSIVTSTNFVESGGAMNGSARYYRVRLVP
jgi:hypothetical protein